MLRSKLRSRPPDNCKTSEEIEFEKVLRLSMRCLQNTLGSRGSAAARICISLLVLIMSCCARVQAQAEAAKAAQLRMHNKRTLAKALQVLYLRGLPALVRRDLQS